MPPVFEGTVTPVSQLKLFDRCDEIQRLTDYRVWCVPSAPNRLLTSAEIMFLTEGDKRAQRLSFDRRNQIERSMTFFFSFEKVSAFLRNLVPLSVLYFGERPEMTSHDRKSSKAKNQKGN